MAFEGSAISREVINCCIAVHVQLGPGLLESAYCQCLAHEFIDRGIPFLREYSIPVRYKRTAIDCGYRVDFMIGDELLLEIKSVESLHSIHTAQMLTYLKLTGIEHGLLINFNAHRVTDGVKSILLSERGRKPTIDW
jgi:GxxExxY protein